MCEDQWFTSDHADECLFECCATRLAVPESSRVNVLVALFHAAFRQTLFIERKRHHSRTHRVLQFLSLARRSKHESADQLVLEENVVYSEMVKVGEKTRSHFDSKSLCFSTQGEVFWCVVFCVVFLSRSWRLVSFLSFCVVCCRINVRSFWPSDGRRWFPNTKKKSWVPGQIRAERVLADAITIDCRKE